MTRARTTLYVLALPALVLAASALGELAVYLTS